jgi:hypothetical protein
MPRGGAGGRARVATARQIVRANPRVTPQQAFRAANPRRAAQSQAVAPTSGGFNPLELVKSGAQGVPFVGPLLSEGISQLAGGSMQMPPGGKGGRRGVQLIDASTGLVLGTIARHRALSLLARKPRHGSTRTVYQSAHVAGCSCRRCR